MIGAPEGSWSFAAGRQYAPFGVLHPLRISVRRSLDSAKAKTSSSKSGIYRRGCTGLIFGFSAHDDKMAVTC